MPEPLKAELTEALGQVSDLADEALDPELSREELVAKVKEIADAAELPEEEDDGDDLEEEEGLD